jgi:hypothetical protein
MMPLNFDDAVLERLGAIASGLGAVLPMFGAIAPFPDRVLGYLDAINENLPSGDGANPVYGFGRFSQSVPDTSFATLQRINTSADNFRVGGGMTYQSASNCFEVPEDGLYLMLCSGRPGSWSNFIQLNLYIVVNSSWQLTTTAFSGSLVLPLAALTQVRFDAYADTNNSLPMEISGSFSILKIA